MPARSHFSSFASALNALTFSPPVAYVYNPLDYARATATNFLRRYATGTGKILLLGMNPGPWGMAQTGVPFGEVNMVRDWLGIKGKITKPTREHPKRPVMGLDCHRSEVSGRRVWGWARDTFGTPDRFFEHFFVANYCPLMFLDADARNLTPDKLPAKERTALESLCDRALINLVNQLQPRRIIGIGKYAESRARAAIANNIADLAGANLQTVDDDNSSRLLANQSPLRKQGTNQNRDRKGAAPLNQNRDHKGTATLNQNRDCEGATHLIQKNDSAVCHCSVSSAKTPLHTISNTPSQSPLRKQRDELNRDRKGAAPLNQNRDCKGAAPQNSNRNREGSTVCHCSVSSAETPLHTILNTPSQRPLRKQRDELNRDRKGAAPLNQNRDGEGAATQLDQVKTIQTIPISSIPHPSPANPAANRGWAKMIDKQLLPLVFATNA